MYMYISMYMHMHMYMHICIYISYMHTAHVRARIRGFAQMPASAFTLAYMYGAPTMHVCAS